MIISVVFEETDQEFYAEFQEDDSFDAEFGELHVVTNYVGGELYEGDYAVTPKIDAQTMPTKDKYLIDDVTIKPIPIFEVSNNSGGNTVYIAKEM